MKPVDRSIYPTDSTKMHAWLRARAKERKRRGPTARDTPKAFYLYERFP